MQRDDSVRPRVPPVFKRVRWRGQTTACPVEHVFGLTVVDADGNKLRIAMNVSEFREIADHITYWEAYRPCQSLMSSDSPSAAGFPQDGQKHVPPATSSTAASAVSCRPRSSLSQRMCQPSSRRMTQKGPFAVGWLYALKWFKGALLGMLVGVRAASLPQAGRPPVRPLLCASHGCHFGRWQLVTELVTP